MTPCGCSTPACTACELARPRAGRQGALRPGPAPHHQPVPGVRRVAPDCCELCGSAPAGPVAREPFDWTFRWLCPAHARPAEVTT
jgi:hypothetical protein